jgi:hypothetical protein
MSFFVISSVCFGAPLRFSKAKLIAFPLYTAGAVDFFHVSFRPREKSGSHIFMKEFLLPVAPLAHYRPVRASAVRWKYRGGPRKQVEHLEDGPHPDPAGLELKKVWEEEWQANFLKSALERLQRRPAPSIIELLSLQKFGYFA